MISLWVETHLTEGLLWTSTDESCKASPMQDFHYFLYREDVATALD